MDNENKAIRTYLLIVLGFSYVFFILELLLGTGWMYQFLSKAFTAVPVLAALITRRLTGVRAKYKLSLRVWKNYKAWAFSALGIGLLISIGALLYFAVFPNEFSGVCRYGQLLGSDAQAVVTQPAVFLLVCMIISALMIPIQLLELGEEIGWRQYLLGWQIDKYGEKKAVLINGVEWGLAHLPLIYFGFNYSLKNPGAPWSNMAVMMLLCIVLGVIFSYVTIKTENCMYAAIMHGVVNVIGELPVFMTFSMESGLLGPNPTGLIGLSPIIVVAVVLFFRLKAANQTKTAQ